MVVQQDRALAAGILPVTSALNTGETMIDRDVGGDPLRPRPTQDAREFFMLPQSPADAGYYVYGLLYKKPAKGAYQYAHPSMITAILAVTHAWQAIDRRRIGIGDISLAGGRQTPDHGTHKSGLEVDVRPVRKDGAEIAVNWWDAEYDKRATEALIMLFRSVAPVKKVLFNGPGVPFVEKASKHDNHFHIVLRGQ